MKRVGLRLKFAVLFVSVMVVAIGVWSVWSAASQQEQAEREMLEKAQVLAQEMDAVWAFFETNQHQFKTDESGNYELYCVIAAKSVSRFFTAETDYVIHYTNLTTRRASDAPDAFETEAMTAFNEDPALDEYYGISKDAGGADVFRYAQPLFMTESCLECHGEPAGELDSFGYPKEGKKVGDLAGAISITMPIDIYMMGIREGVVRDVVFFGTVLLIELVVIFYGLSRLVTRPLGRLEEVAEEVEDGNLAVETCGIGHRDEISDLAGRFGSMAARLRDSYDSLEAQVQDRTEQLARANAVLEEQRIRLEAANAVLAEANEFKSDFLATMSHELRTPLTSILAFAEIWEKADTSRDDREREAVHEIRENGQILLDMVDNILEAARSEAGRLTLVAEPVEMVDLANATEERMSFLAQRRSVDLEFVVGSDTPIIMADWEKLRRIVENLVANAIKYTNPGGSVRVEVRGCTEPEGVIVEVKDTGIGISEENLPFIFDKYTQVDRSSQKRREGSGLGLAVVKDLVELHGGSVSVESELGKGSAFRVFIPAGDNDWGGEREDNAC